MARSLVADTDRLDDCVQDTWVAALERARRPQGPIASSRAWLGGVIRNVARQSNRSERRRAERELGSACERDPLPSAQEVVEKAELQKRVVQAVLDLDEPYRSTLLLSFFEGLSAERIGRRTGVPASTVRNRVKRALDRLRARFDREHGGDRRAWSRTLLPLAAPEVGAAPVSTGAAAPSLGALTMTTKALVATAVGLLFGFGGAFAYRQVTLAEVPDHGLTLARPAASRAAQDPEPAPSDPDARQPVPEVEHVVAGRVTDARGRAVPDAWVLVGGRPSPFEGWFDAGMHLGDGSSLGHSEQLAAGGWKELASLSVAKLVEEDLVLGRRFRTDASGRFEARLPESRRVYVNVMRDVGLRNRPEQGTWIETPKQDLALSAQRVPTASVTVTVVEDESGEALRAFELHLSLERHAWARTWEARGRGLETRVELPRGADTLSVELLEPSWARASARVDLAPGARETVELRLDAGAGFQGRVVDSFGNPVQDAWVFWGEASKLRGRNLFRPFSLERVPHGVRSGIDGSFVLPGAWHEVSAYHADHSPATVATAEGANLVLAERSRIVGYVYDRQGNPRVDSEVSLDGGVGTVTGADGRYVFENVEAGVHSLRFGDRQWRGITVPPGVTYDVPRAPVFGKVEVEVLSGGLAYEGAMGGVVLGLAEFFTLHEFETEQSRLTLHRVLPGDYLLLTRKGHLGRFHVESERSVLELGDADLTVAAEPGTALVLVPAGSGEVARYWAERMAQEVDPSGRATFAPLVAGRYEVGIRGEGTWRAIEVPGPGTQVQLH